MANYAFGMNPIPTVENNHTFTGDNFLQLSPHTEILSGVSGLTFVNCNLTNCDIPQDAECIGCRPHHLSFCTHINPKLIERGLTECEVDCEHLVSAEDIILDGVVIDTIYQYEIKAVD